MVLGWCQAILSRARKAIEVRGFRVLEEGEDLEL